MNKSTCDKCSRIYNRLDTVRAYSDTRRDFVRLCVACAKTNPAGYHLTFESKRVIGIQLPKGQRA